MVQTLVQANDCLFQIDIGDGYVDALCFKSFTLNITTDEKETTTVSDGQFKSFDYKVLSYTVNLNGGMRIPDSIVPALFDLVEYQVGFIPVPFRIIWRDPQSNIRTFTGVAIVKSSNLLANASQLADITIDMIGTGEFVIGTSIETLVDLTLIMTGDDNAIALGKFKLLNSDGDTIFQSDTLPQANGGNLANPFNITTQIPAGTYFIYWQVQCNNVNNTFNLNAPPTLNQNFNNGTSNYSSFNIQSYNFTAHRTVTFTLGTSNPPPTCVPPTLGSLNNHNGTEGVAFVGNIVASGSQPFSITNVVKPAWMDISISSGNIIVLSGTPTAGNDQVVSFDVTNACGTASFSDNVDIATNSNLRNIEWTFGEVFEPPSTSFIFRIYKNAVQVVDVNDSNSGNFSANVGDTIEVNVFGVTSTPDLKTTTVTGSVAGVIYNDATTTFMQAFSWVVASGNDYSINSQVVPNEP